MSDDPSAQRTLVKSPPELWAEVSDAASLAKHLGEFGEIRIARLEPETTVVWEGDHATGVIELEKSGWGTRVTIRAAPAESEVPPEEPEPIPEPAPPRETLCETAEDQPEGRALAEEAPAPPRETLCETAEDQPEGRALAEEAPVKEEPAPVAEEEPAPAAEEEPAPVAEEEPAPRPGFFARLFGGRRRLELSDRPVAEVPGPVEPTPTPPDVGPAPDPLPPVHDPEPTPQPDPEPLPEPTPLPTPPAEPEPPAAAEIRPPEVEPAVSAPALDAEKVQELLNGALDTLGAAHHRPFSR